MALPIIAFCGALLAAAACGIHFRSGSGEIIRGSGQQVQQEFSVTAFKKIDISHAFQCYYKPAENFSVSIKTYENILPCVDVQCTGDCLKIAVKDGISIESSEQIVVDIAAPSIDAIRLSGASSLYDAPYDTSSDRPMKVIQESLHLDLSGASGCALYENLTAKDIHAKISGSSMAYFFLAENLYVHASGNSQLTYRGLNRKTIEKAVIHASGLSGIDGKNIPVKSMKIHVSGGGKAEVMVTEELDAEATGMSEIIYNGNPKKISRETSGMAKIKKA